MNYPNKIQSRPSLAADQPILGVAVPNYNTQRSRAQNKKIWWGWDSGGNAGAKSKVAAALKVNPSPPAAALTAIGPTELIVSFKVPFSPREISVALRLYVDDVGIGAGTVAVICP